MRIATRCTTVDEFVTGFFAFCDDVSCFIPTLGMRAVGLETAFSIQLVDGTPMLRGLCVVLDAWSTPANPFKRPGLRVGLRRMTPESAPILAKLKAARAAAEAETARSAIGTTPPAGPPPDDDDNADGFGDPTTVERSNLLPPPQARAVPVLRIPPIGSVAPTTVSVAKLATAASEHVPEEFETPTLETKLPVEERAAGSAFILPANPLTALTDASIGAFIDCVLYEDADPFPPEFAPEGTPVPDEDLENVVSPPLLSIVTSTTPAPPVLASLSRMMATPTPGSRPPIPTILGVAPLGVPRDQIDAAHARPMPAPRRDPTPPPMMEPIETRPPRAETENIRSPRSGVQLSIVLGVALAAVIVALLVWLVALRGGAPQTAPIAPAIAPPPTSTQISPPVPPAPKVDTAARTPVLPSAPPIVRPREDGELPAVGTGPCRIIANSDPAGAAVAVDGEAVGPTPLAIDGPCRARKLEFTHARYAKLEKTVTPAAAAPTPIDVSLQRPTHQLKILSTPSGATVSINGRRAGTTPAIVAVMGFSNVNISVERAGFKAQSKRVYSNLPIAALSFDLKK